MSEVSDAKRITTIENKERVCWLIVFAQKETGHPCISASILFHPVRRCVGWCGVDVVADRHK